MKSFGIVGFGFKSLGLGFGVQGLSVLCGGACASARLPQPDCGTTGLENTHRLLSSSFLRFIFRILKRQSQKGTTKEPMGMLMLNVADSGAMAFFQGGGAEVHQGRRAQDHMTMQQGLFLPFVRPFAAAILR